MKNSQLTKVATKHWWFKPKFMKYECCRICGIVRRKDAHGADLNKPCRGPVKMRSPEGLL